jgi:hypothetical protein
MFGGNSGIVTCNMFFQNDRDFFQQNPKPSFLMSSAYFLPHDASDSDKAIPITSHGGTQGCATSRLPYFIDNRITDGGKVVSLKRLPAAIYLQEHSWHSFLLEAE